MPMSHLVIPWPALSGQLLLPSKIPRVPDLEPEGSELVFGQFCVHSRPRKFVEGRPDNWDLLHGVQYGCSTAWLQAIA